MKGYKGFNKGLICRGKQYVENTVFEEDEAVMCEKGLHFCQNPLAVFGYYPPSNAGELNEYAEVEALDEVASDGDKSVTKKLMIGRKIGIDGLIKAFIDFTFEHIKKEKSKNGDQSAATNTGDWSAATNTGYQSVATNTGYQSAATNTGNQSAATVGEGDSVAIATGYQSRARAGLGSALVICERGEWDGEKCPLLAIKAAIVDGKKLKPDTFYTLKNGRFIKAED